MSDYPTSIYEGRERANKPGFPFDPDKDDTLFGEDADAWDDEITAIEEDLTAKNSFHEFWYKPLATGGITISSGGIGGGVQSITSNPDYPRQLQLSAFNLSPIEHCIATFTITGLDQDGNEIEEIIMIDLEPLAGVFFDTDHAFSKVTSIVISEVSGNGIYTLGVTNKFGVRHYPFLSEDKFYSYTIDNINTTMPALDLTYGLITLPADEIRNFGLWYKK